MILAYRNGAPIRVRDVGQAVDGRRERQHRGAWDNDKPRVLLLVFKQPGANVIDTVDQIKAALPRLSAVIPPAMKVDIIVDRTADHPRLGAGRASSRSRSPSGSS